MVADEGKYLRVKATYDDMEGDDKVAYVRSNSRCVRRWRTLPRSTRV